MKVLCMEYASTPELSWEGEHTHTQHPVYVQGPVQVAWIDQLHETLFSLTSCSWGPSECWCLRLQGDNELCGWKQNKTQVSAFYGALTSRNNWAPSSKRC